MELPSALRAPAALRLPAAEAVSGKEGAGRSDAGSGGRGTLPPRPEMLFSAKAPQRSSAICTQPRRGGGRGGGAKTNVSHNALWMEVIQRGLLCSTGNFLWNR